MGSIGRKILDRRTNYEALLTAKIGLHATDTNLTEGQLNEVLKELQIVLSTDERQAHETWFHRSRNT